MKSLRGKGMKRFLAMILLSVMVITALTGCGGGKATTQTESKTPTVSDADPSTFKGELTYWTYFDQAPYIVKAFTSKYPNVKIDLQTFGGDQYQTKLMTTIQSGKGIPDMFDLEEGYVYKFLDSDAVANLGPLGANDLVKDYYPWAAAMGKDSKGNLKGVCNNVSPVAYWYLRDVMQKWLGTSDPDQIADKLSSWDKIIAAAKDVKQKSNGTVYLWPNMDEVVKVEGYSITPFVRNGKFAVDSKWYDVLKTMRTLYDQKLTANLDSWGQDWANQWNQGKLLIRVMPSWDFFTDWKKNTGNVGVAKPLKGSYEGGTYTALYAKSDKKDLAMQFIKFVTTTDFQIDNLKTNNQMPANTKVFDQIGADYTASKFGNQNILKTYNDILKTIPNIVPDKYTRDVQNIFGKHAEQGIKKGESDEQIIKEFETEVKDKYPEIEGLQ